MRSLYHAARVLAFLAGATSGILVPPVLGQNSSPPGTDSTFVPLLIRQMPGT